MSEKSREKWLEPALRPSQTVPYLEEAAIWRYLEKMRALGASTGQIEKRLEQAVQLEAANISAEVVEEIVRIGSRKQVTAWQLSQLEAQLRLSVVGE